MLKIVRSPSKEDKAKYSIVSGTTFGSSFVGIVHILDSTNRTVGDILAAGAASLQATLNAGSIIESAEGRTGLDDTFATNVKNLISQQNISSHVTLLSMGTTPPTLANEVAKSGENFEKFDPQSTMAQIAALQNVTVSDRTLIESMAADAHTGEQSARIQDKVIASSVSALTEVDETKNKILDVNAMMAALDDYLKKAAEGNCGVPVNYYLKDIDQKMLAEMWAAKYAPDKFMSIKYDE